MKLLLTRHGQTDWNEAGKHQGISDIPLNEEGLAQARLLAQRLQREKIDVIYCSALQRAKQTASVIGKGREAEIIVREDLNERNYGKWDGLTEDQIKDQFGDDYGAYVGDRYAIGATDGESIKQVAKRVASFVEMLQEESSDKTVLVVTHSGTLRALLSVLLDYPHEEVAQMRLKAASLTSISITGGKITLDFINSVDHLGEEMK